MNHQVTHSGENRMKQLTVRGFDDELSDCIRREAEQEGISLNRAALRLLRRGAGLSEVPGKRPKIGHSLDQFAGIWTKEEAEEFDRIIEEMTEVIDEEKWQ